MKKIFAIVCAVMVAAGIPGTVFAGVPGVFAAADIPGAISGAGAPGAVGSVCEGVADFMSGSFAPACVYADSSSMELDIAEAHYDSEPVDSLYDADVHFLWDESYYIDETERKHRNAYVNHPDQVSWNVDDRENSASYYTTSRQISDSDARKMTRVLGASEDFYQELTKEDSWPLSIPNIQYSYSGMYVEVDFSYDPSSVELAFVRKPNYMTYGSLKCEAVYYVPMVKGRYTITFYDEYSSGKEMGKMVIPVTGEIHYQFKYSNNLADNNNAGYNYAWNGMVIRSENHYMSIDTEWLMGTYFHEADSISDDIVLRVGESYDLNLYGQNPAEGVFDLQGQETYYLVTDDGLVECSASELPVDVGYNPECAEVSNLGIVTAKKPGSFRVDVYYPTTRYYLSYKITVEGGQTDAKFVIGQSFYTDNGAVKTMDAAPYLDNNNRTMVPIRYIARACGVDDNAITWDSASQTATIKGASNTISIKMGSSSMQTSKGVVTMDTVAVNKNGRIYVPLRFIAEELGVKVGWEQATKTITLK